MTRRRALISVADKDGVADFARGLVDLGFEIVPEIVVDGHDDFLLVAQGDFQIEGAADIDGVEFLQVECSGLHFTGTLDDVLAE